MGVTVDTGVGVAALGRSGGGDSAVDVGVTASFGMAVEVERGDDAVTGSWFPVAGDWAKLGRDGVGSSESWPHEIRVVTNRVSAPQQTGNTRCRIGSVVLLKLK